MGYVKRFRGCEGKLLFFNFDLEFKFKCEGGIYWGYLLELSKRVMYEGNSTVTELQFRGILGSIL